MKLWQMSKFLYLMLLSVVGASSVTIRGMENPDIRRLQTPSISVRFLATLGIYPGSNTCYLESGASPTYMVWCENGASIALVSTSSLCTKTGPNELTCTDDNFLSVAVTIVYVRTDMNVVRFHYVPRPLLTSAHFLLGLHRTEHALNQCEFKRIQSYSYLLS
jgi:hypothetical protein